MKILLLTIIKIYWQFIPEKRRRPCVFRKSCSKYVFEKTKEEGFFSGLKALKYRFLNCRNGIEIFENPVNGETQIILPSLEILNQSEISERFLQKINT